MVLLLTSVSMGASMGRKQLNRWKKNRMEESVLDFVFVRWKALTVFVVYVQDEGSIVNAAESKTTVGGAPVCRDCTADTAVFLRGVSSSTNE